MGPVSECVLGVLRCTDSYGHFHGKKEKFGRIQYRREKA